MYNVFIGDTYKGFAKFNDCKKIEFNKVFQKGIKTKLKSLLKDKLE